MASTSIGSFAGIGSGFDYTSLVDQIIGLASKPVTTAQNRIDASNAKLSALTNYRTLLDTLDKSAKAMRDGTAFDAVATTVSGSAANGKTILSASAKAGAAPGSYAVQVLAVAQAEKLSGASFADSTSALGLTGDFRINGKTISIVATDTLANVRDKINVANTGTAPSGVSAAIIADSSSAVRLVLTSTKTGAAGIDLVDGTAGLAQQLGWIDNTSTIKHTTSAGAESDRFASSTDTLATQLGLTGAGPQTVTVGGQSVAIDLSTDSLDSLATKLSALTGIEASVKSETVDGTTKYYLDIRNTTAFTDTGNVLQQLGVLKAGRSSTTHVVQGAALTAGDASTPATASTLLTSLWNGGGASNAQAGDTLTISGTRGDGTAVNVTFTIGAGSTVQDLLDALNDPTTGFGGGTKPATASIDASGRLTFTNNTAGSSALSAQIVANNQGGGRLDLGAFSATTVGRDRVLVAGADARFSVDGVLFTRSTNSITDVISDTTLTLMAADPTITATVSVDRSADTVKQSIQAFVDAYNKLAEFIKQQQTPGKDASSNPPLYGESVLRIARSSLANMLLQPVAGAAEGLTTAGMAGISLTREGTLTFDADKFTTAFTTRYDDLLALFKESGTTDNSQLSYVSSTKATQSGAYAVDITQAAAQGTITGAGFSGTYADDGTPDVLRITDVSNNYTASVQLSNGMTTAQIVDAINSALAAPQAAVLASPTALYEDAGSATPASASTLLTALYQGGSSAGVAAGDTITMSGVRPDGTSYTATFTVAANSTLGDLTAQLQSSVGSGASVSIVDGKITVAANSAGVSPLSVTLAANNQNGGTLSLGALTASTVGRSGMSVTASAVGNDIVLTAGSYGQANGFSIAFTGGGSDGTAQLGLAAGEYRGTDVVGTIGGYAATGTGQQLVGSTGTPVEGLTTTYRGSTTGAIGTVTLTQGVGATIDRLLTSWLEANTGTIAMKETSLGNTIKQQQARIDTLNARLEFRRQSLLKQFLAMDTAVSKYSAQANAFASVLPKQSSSS